MLYFSDSYKEEGKRNFRISTRKRKSGNVAFSAKISALITLSVLTSSVQASDRTPLETKQLSSWVNTKIEQEIASYAKRQRWPDYETEIELSIPASADHLPACPTALYISAADQQNLPVGYLRRQVECQSGSQPWKLNVTAQVRLRIPVIVAATHIRRDTKLSATMLKTQTLTLSRDEAFATRPEQVLGQRTLRRIRSGQVISPLQLQPLWLVEDGESVMIIASKNGMEASMKGEALQNGVKGEQISVRNSTSGKVIDVIVVDRGKVQTIF
ncbi:flagellar basal body P-ring formation chaperone FlgA [Photobacterium sp. 1_MG-2023]|uniref:flagellar basal body P-ring formation chaperone FlgA n=1 Tax=Photobacterium sp. 1_MG-2023 TaxID=3062646 RepID=UPI0026E3C09D|nr:flagellar basal body P-ring formation chaperone FlgA [Photobacterium sp. 1_MG-2023]MDO6705549.1 flagellar basal body P-ring formation chaperone FlgA [Photobacterium sp. 1_MG-2023]